MNEGNPSHVSIDGDADIAVVTIQRPERRNALSSAAARAVKDAIQAASEQARVVILTGAGKAFCAGGDLEELEKWSELDPNEIGTSLYETFQGMIRAVRSASAIVIAAINGAAVGAGMDLALACDLRVASRNAKLGQVWVGLGVIPGTGGAYFTTALAGPTRAAELLLTGDIISADEALAAGLLNEVTDGDVVDAARALAARILKNPRDGVVANKRAYVGATEAAVEAALEHAARVQPERFTSEEFKAALSARRNKS
ncbi:MAG TPA: enoyl-CoA hydratase/isomerase family protein [Actinomycetota bacterium]|nr:enoyl-CoA hydratase/isomerase family protein [Actinomycetota bacterium]